VTGQRQYFSISGKRGHSDQRTTQAAVRRAPMLVDQAANENQPAIPQARKKETDSRDTRGKHPAPLSRLSFFRLFRKVSRFA
jgi:hypothetical protein